MYFKIISKCITLTVIMGLILSPLPASAAKKKKSTKPTKSYTIINETPHEQAFLIYRSNPRYGVTKTTVIDKIEKNSTIVYKNPKAGYIEDFRECPPSYKIKDGGVFKFKIDESSGCCFLIDANQEYENQCFFSESNENEQEEEEEEAWG